MTFVAVAVASLRPRAASDPIAPAPLFVSDNPHSIYAADPNDSWNRIFRALFTRTVKHRVSDAFSEGAPFVSFYVRMGSFPLRISSETLSRTERGDRAIEPLYPTFFTTEGPRQILSDPLFSELTTALREAIDETKTRSPIERALMQADVWAAYDILYATKLSNGHTEISERAAKVLRLQRQFIRKLAMSSDEIKSLKTNYVTASGSKVPNLFSTESGWLEIELLPQRHHDDVASYRRAARVFVKPRIPPTDASKFVESLKHNQHHDQIEAVALIVQNLLIDTSGRVVPSPVFSDVQLRFYKNDPQTKSTSAEALQFELSRGKLLTEPASGGFVEFTATAPAYLTYAGNDYDFATPIGDLGVPIVVPLRTRCTQCHNSSLTTLMTFSIHDFPPVPTTKVLRSSDQERALHVARRKEERDDFKSLF